MTTSAVSASVKVSFLMFLYSWVSMPSDDVIIFIGWVSRVDGVSVNGEAIPPPDDGVISFVVDTLDFPAIGWRSFAGSSFGSPALRRIRLIISSTSLLFMPLSLMFHLE